MTEQNKDKIYLFEKAEIPQAVISLCVPMIFASLVNVIYSLADTFFVAQINDPIQNAAVTIASPLLMSYNAITALFGVGASSLMSRLMGKRHYEDVRHVSADGIYMCVISGLIYSILILVFQESVCYFLGADPSNIVQVINYTRWTVVFGAIPSILNVTMAYLIRSEGSALIASIGTMSGCIMNIILDPLFILPSGFGMGAQGAGLATLLANIFACSYFLIYLFLKRNNTFISLDPKMIRIRKDIIKEIFNVGIPTMIANFMTVASQLILTNMIASYGANEVTSAFGIAFKIDLIPSTVCQGLSTGIMPLVGYNYADGNGKRMKEAIYYVFRIAIVVISIVTLFYLFFAEDLVKIFMDNQKVISYGAMFLRGLCTALPFYCVDFISIGICQACGLGKYSLYSTILRNGIIEIPAFIILFKLFSIYGVCYGYLFAEIGVTLFTGSRILKLLNEMGIEGNDSVYSRKVPFLKR